MKPNAQLLPVRLLFLLLALVAVLLLSSTRVSAGEPLVTTEYTVVTGDTLWEIAAAVTDPGESVRRTIDTVREINRLDSSMLLPGQKLLLPAG
jgi:nucleoid-associated protein YgaU